MKPYIRTTFIWFLSLTLSGMPLVTQAKAGIVSGEDATVQDTNASASNVTRPCHGKQEASLPGLAGVSADTGAKILSSAVDNGCCDAQCQCQHDKTCHSIHCSNASVTAILVSVHSMVFDLNSTLVLDPVILYSSCDRDTEIIPPIV